jgi:branched-chain amino acid transport system permease protein
VFGDSRDMWRAIFITLLAFLVLVLGANRPRSAVAVLLGLAVVCLLPVGAAVSGSAWNFWRSLAVTLMIMFLLAMAIERLALRPLVNQEHIILFMVTIGLNFFIEGMAQGVWDSQVHGLDIGIADKPIQSIRRSTGLLISRFDVFAAVTAGVLVAGLGVFFQKTRIGRALRAVADDHQAALTVGISLKDIWAIVWSAAGFVALVAGILWGAKVGVQFSLSLIVLKALPVLILGGLTSVPGTVVGGFLVGATEKLVEVFIGIPYFGGGTESWTPYVMALAFLLIRPQGLFGERIIERV